MNENSYSYKAELYRLNCIEISSELINPKYEEYPILFVDNAIKSKNELTEYENYVLGARNGMPSWKDYYAIKNLVETLEEVAGLENDNAKILLKQVKKRFIKNLYSKININKDNISPAIEPYLFPILQKLELFFPEDNSFINLLLKIDYGKLSKTDLINAKKQLKTLFKEDHYFLDNEKIFLTLNLEYFDSQKQTSFNKKLAKLKNTTIKKSLSEVLSKVKVFE